MLENPSHAIAGVAEFFDPSTLDTMMRERTHLVFSEFAKLMEALKGSRNAARDRCFLLLMLRHGLRVSAACGLKLSQVDIDSRSGMV
jgi:type 1 fimbriae regulatory protein FimB